MPREAVEDITRLPRWAQNKIANLERQLASRDAYIDQYAARYGESNVRISGSVLYPDVSIPDDSEIDFYLSAERVKFRNMISVRHQRSDRTRLYVAGTGGRCLLVEPRSCNVVELRLEN